jgi:hypothetical protein
MANINRRNLLSLLIAAGGCIAGAYSAFAAFSNGATIAQGTAGTMFGLAFAAVVVISWIMLPWADKRSEDGSHRDAWLWRASWLLALGFVLANSVAYCAHYRIEMTETKGLQIEAYERAQRAEALASTELNGLRTNYRWGKTSGCSNAIDLKSRRYCDHLRDVQSRIQEAQATLALGRPGAKDPGAEVLAWVLGADEAKVRRSLPIFWAVILELIASLCMREAFASLRPLHAAKRDLPMGFAAPSRTMADYPAMTSKIDDHARIALFGMHTMFGRQNAAEPQREAMNDNMPRLAYA